MLVTYVIVGTSALIIPRNLEAFSALIFSGFSVSNLTHPPFSYINYINITNALDYLLVSLSTLVLNSRD